MNNAVGDDRTKGVIVSATQDTNDANELNSTESAMPKFLLLIGVILLMADYSFAQDYSPDPTPMQCQLIKQAVAHMDLRPLGVTP